MPKKTTYSENMLADVGRKFFLSPHIQTITVFQFKWSNINCLSLFWVTAIM